MRRSATASGSTWIAGAGCPATLGRNISSSMCLASMRPSSRTGLIAGSSGRSQASCRRPRPQLSATATGVILNPWWEVPKSIEHEAAGKKGFVPVKGPDGEIQRWRQPPGPTNALGQIKFVMPNSKAIYLHDTNARSRFNSDARALSHGCVRTEHIMDLADQLLGDDDGEWTAGPHPGGARQQEDGAGKLREAAAGLHRLFQLGCAERWADRRLQGPLRPRFKGDGGAAHEGRRRLVLPPKPKPEDEVVSTPKPKPASKLADKTAAR